MEIAPSICGHLEAICHCGEALWCCWEPPIKLWRLPQPCLYGFGDRPQGSLSRITTSCIVQGREEITVALVESWGALCLHTAPTEISIRKGVNFGIHHRLRVPRLSLTRTLYLCTLLCDSHIVYCHISCYHLVVYLA